MPYFLRIVRGFLVAGIVFLGYHYFIPAYKSPILTLKTPLNMGPLNFRLYNKTDALMWLDIVDHSGGMHAGYASGIDAHHYSIFYLSKGQMQFYCYQGVLGVTSHKVSCGEVLDVKIASLSLHDNNLGNYWVVQNILKS